MKLYKVKPASLWGEDKSDKRTKQLAALAALNLHEEPTDSCVYCSADDAIALMTAGYTSPYAHDEYLPILIWSREDSLENLFNAKCSQVQPSVALFGVRRLTLIEDACTDMIQSLLCDGWSILAIQPQPDQRRPDYILGRHDLEQRDAERK